MTNQHDSPAAGSSPPRRVLRSIGLSLPMLLLTAFMMIGPNGPPRETLPLVTLLATFIFTNTLFFLMVYTRRIDRYRAVFFITMAVCFVIGFITNLLEIRGSMALTQENVVNGETPFCHMVIPMTIIPAALTRTIIFPGSLDLNRFANIPSMFVIWIGVSLALGRGFCSWGCFFGGLEDGFSRILKKPLLRKIPDKLTYLPYAVLIAMVLLAAVTLSPTYCEWLCPFKTVTEFAAVTSLRSLIQAFIFVGLFLSLVVVLPILTRRRTQCGLFCPMGAFQGFTNKVSPFDIRIDPQRCNGCLRCARVCPTFSLDSQTIMDGRTRISCSKCGKCVDECPQGAITYHIKGAPVEPQKNRARMLYLYPAFLFLAVFGGSMIQGGVYRLLLLLTTGRLIH